MKTGKFFAVFWLGVAMLVATGGLEISSAVWHEVQVQQSKPLDQTRARLDADKTHGQTIRETNSGLGWPGFAFLTIGAVGWIFRPMPGGKKKAKKTKAEDFPGRADPGFFDALAEKTNAYFVGFNVSNP